MRHHNDSFMTVYFGYIQQSRNENFDRVFLGKSTLLNQFDCSASEVQEHSFKLLRSLLTLMLKVCSKNMIKKTL